MATPLAYHAHRRADMVRFITVSQTAALMSISYLIALFIGRTTLAQEFSVQAVFLIVGLVLVPADSFIFFKAFARKRYDIALGFLLLTGLCVVGAAFASFSLALQGIFSVLFGTGA